MKLYPETKRAGGEANKSGVGESQGDFEAQAREEGGSFNSMVIQLCLVLATAGLVMIGIGIASFYWLQDKPGKVESSGLVADASAPLASLSAPIELLPAASAPVASSAPLASASEPFVSASSPAVLASPRRLSREEVASLLPLLQSGEQPADCESAIRDLVAERNLIVRQAKEIAKMAYPELCAPASPPSEGVSAQPEANLRTEFEVSSRSAQWTREDGPPDRR